MASESGRFWPGNELGMEADLFLGRRRWSDELLDRFEHDRELLVIFLLERFDFAGEITVCVHEAAQLHEGAHDGDIDLDSARAAEDAGKHRDALFGEGIREVATSAIRT